MCESPNNKQQTRGVQFNGCGGKCLDCDWRRMSNDSNNDNNNTYTACPFSPPPLPLQKFLPTPFALNGRVWFCVYVGGAHTSRRGTHGTTKEQPTDHNHGKRTGKPILRSFVRSFVRERALDRRAWTSNRLVVFLLFNHPQRYGITLSSGWECVLFFSFVVVARLFCVLCCCCAGCCGCVRKYFFHSASFLLSRFVVITLHTHTHTPLLLLPACCVPLLQRSSFHFISSYLIFIFCFALVRFGSSLSWVHQ